jgi:hypothetical protein
LFGTPGRVSEFTPLSNVILPINNYDDY